MFAGLLGVISTFIYLYVPDRFERVALEALQNRTEALATIQAFTVRSGVVFGDTLAISEALQGAMLGDEVLYIAVRDSAGALLTELDDRQPGSEWDLEPISASVPVMLADARIGTLELVASSHALRREARESANFIALVSLIIFTVGTLLTVAISTTVTRPLRKIIGSTEVIAEGDLQHRISTDGPVEIGQLARSMNLMVSRLRNLSAQNEAGKDKLERILDNLPLAVTVYGDDGHIEYVNPAAVPEPDWRQWILGRSEEEYWRHRGFSASDGVYPTDMIRETLAAQSVSEVQSTLTMPDGSERIHARGFAPIGSAAGNRALVIGYAIDVTERTAAARALEISQEQLRQAQKMESLGRLAGGVAHDFNNLLGAIIANCDLLLMETPPEDGSVAEIEEIAAAADRAAGLTAQLLAFSRKQVMQPTVLDVNGVVSSIAGMLRRLIGPEIKLALHLYDDLPFAFADAGQMEQVIVNLVVNARDAMPGGGSLILSTDTVQVQSTLLKSYGNLTPGRYVRLSVTDTGFGMDEDTLARIFEPFFTTKAPGEGTGLGLSTMYGILEQSGGSVTAYSEVGTGSTFRVYLPAAESELNPEPTTADRNQMLFSDSTRNETILLVEDTASVRAAASKILVKCGYRVVECEAAAEAVAHIDSGAEFHLLLTDVVMPDMGGAELATLVAARRPDLPVLFMSGYTFDSLQHRGVLDPKVALIEKPFTAVELSQAVRAALEAGAGQNV
ncbi:MAG: ATP-binding protein [Gemmatimonadota bacterium]|nr:ATP-binding protein [Gemmatimonadota bacterium]